MFSIHFTTSSIFSLKPAEELLPDLSFAAALCCIRRRRIVRTVQKSFPICSRCYKKKIGLGQLQRSTPAGRLAYRFGGRPKMVSYGSWKARDEILLRGQERKRACAFLSLDSHIFPLSTFKSLREATPRCDRNVQGDSERSCQTAACMSLS